MLLSFEWVYASNIKRKEVIPMTVSYHFTLIYKRVRPIVLKTRGTYMVRLWEGDDWDQEGMIALHELLTQHSELVLETGRLCVYFKTKFTNRVKDALRRQESLKRQFDRMTYEEIGEIAHMVPTKGFDVSEQVAYNEMVSTVSEELTQEEKDKLDCVMGGKCFRGKRAFQRQMKTKLDRLGWGPDIRWLDQG